MSNINKGRGGRITACIISGLFLLGAAGFVTYEHLADRTYKVTFDVNGGQPNIPSQKVAQYGFAREPEEPTKDGYRFQYWFDVTEGQHWVFDVNHVQQDTTLQAQWTLVNYSITYILDGGTNDSSNPTEYTIESETITLQPATKTDYTFAGWENDDGEVVTEIEEGSFGDITLTALWN